MSEGTIIFQASVTHTSKYSEEDHEKDEVTLTINF